MKFPSTGLSVRRLTWREFFREDSLADLRKILLCALLIPGIWRFVLGWDSSRMVGGHDGTTFLPYLKALLDQNGDWTRNIYQWLSHGGYEVHNAFGFQPVYRLWAWMGLGPTHAYDATVLFCQAIFAFLCARIVEDLCILLGPHLEEGESKASWIEKWLRDSALVALFGFLPVLGYRLGYGHLIIVIGHYIFLAFVSLLLARASGRLSPILILLCFAGLTQMFPMVAQQTLVYSVVFGAPFVLALFWVTFSRNRDWGLIGIPVVVTASALLVSLPPYAGLLHHAFGPEAMRRLGTQGITYSYATAVLNDWITSIPWGYQVWDFNRHPDLHHEINYPIGPVLLLALAFPFRSIERRAGIALLSATLVAACLSMLFSSDIKPVSDAMLALIPPLQLFRVPERSFILITLLITILGATGAAAGFNRKVRLAPGDAVYFIAGIALFWMNLENGSREILLWSMTVLTLASLLIAHRIPEKARRLVPSGIGALIFLAAGAIFSFSQRSIPHLPIAQLEEDPARARAHILKAQPALAHPLNRAVLNVLSPALDFNTAAVIGIPTLDGYGLAPRRLMHLIFRLRGEEIPATSNRYHLTENAPEFPVLQPLYNILYAVDLTRGQFIVRNLRPTLGPAWFSTQLKSVANLDSLAAILRENKEQLLGAARGQSLILNDDYQKLFGGFIPDLPCRVIDPQIQVDPIADGTPGLDVKLGAFGGRCTVTLSLTYSPSLAVYSAETGERLSTFPSYGLLEGILVPQGTRTLRVVPEPYLPTWARVAQVFGCLLLIAITVQAAVRDRSGS